MSIIKRSLIVDEADTTDPLPGVRDRAMDAFLHDPQPPGPRSFAVLLAIGRHRFEVLDRAVGTIILDDERRD